MEFQSTQHTIDRLILRIRTGRLGLPDFQRDFVWNPARVVELLDSVARQWPIGSLLLLSGPQKFGFRGIESGPALDPSDPLDTYVLDGQQRLTSLFHAIADVSDYCYFIDFKALASGGEEFVAWEKRSIFESKYPSLESRANSHIALVREVWENDLFFSWVEGVGDSAKQRDFVHLRERNLAGLQARVYKVMAIELDQDIRIEALARIFETLNRTGVRLSAFDLMVALLYPIGFRLRDEWECALAENPILSEFDTDPVEILKLCSLLIRHYKGRDMSRGVRQGDLLELDRQLIRDSWPDAVRLYSRSLREIHQRLGVKGAYMLPAPSMVLCIAAFLLRDGDLTRETEQWFWTASFKQAFSQAANTAVVSQFDDIFGQVSLRDMKVISRSTLVTGKESARKNGMAARGLAALLVARGAKDPISGIELKNEKIVASCALESGKVLSVVRKDTNLEDMLVCSVATEREIKKRGLLPLEDGMEVTSWLASQYVDRHTGGRDLGRLLEELMPYGGGYEFE
jgi:hypothetical protein